MTQPTARPGSGLGGAVQALAFLCELALLAALAVAGAELPGATWARIALAVALPVVAVAVWSRWMAPTSSTRLGDPARLVAQVVLFVATGALLALAGHPVWGSAFAVVAIAAFAIGRRYEDVGEPQSA